MKKKILLTGAAGGIGSEISKLLTVNNYEVIAVDRDESKLEILGANENIQTIVCDLSNGIQLKSLCESINKLSFYGIVHCAGFGGPFCNIEETTNDHWQSVQDCNVGSLFQILRAILPSMKNKKEGRIVAISSIQGRLGAAGSGAYVASKHALEGLIKTVADEVGVFGVAANSIAPGYIQSPMGANDDKKSDYEKNVLSRTPTESIGQSTDVAQLVLHLLNFPSNYLNGTSITLDGGISATVGV